ncbi:MAG: YdcF family protein [Actinomycetota bacterium]
MRWVRGHPLVAVLGAFVFAALAVIATSAVVVWRAAHHDGAADLDAAGAIVVLGAAQYDGDPSPVLAGRLDHALLLWEQGRAGVVLTLGANRPGDRTTEAEAGRAYLIAHGVPADAVVALPAGRTTWESMQAASAWLLEHDRTSAFFVSDPWHNARLEAMAEDLGVDGFASATWTSAATSEEERGRGYLRETFAYLAYRLIGGG